jgi:xanthine/CO dehydrogenase XdhC/CoxF family maturation factor
MNRRETERILEVIHRVRASGGRAALATVVRVRGSAYRREGARIVVREDRTYECLLSGGCLEPAVTDAALHVMATGKQTVIRYDLADDSVWGLGIGCTGAVDILIERLGDDPLARAWFDVLERAEPAVLVTGLAGVSGRLLVRQDQAPLGKLDDAAIEASAVARARARLSTQWPVSRAETIGHADLFFEISAPPPQLVMFGAGPDAVPLVRDARELGFAVTVVDVREGFLTAERFPGATLVSTHFSRFAEAVSLGTRSFVVIMNHHLERDEQSLGFALASDARYIGVLGPRSRYVTLIERLRAHGAAFDAASLSRVRSPVGLALGAETPEEIAVSIVGEIIAVLRGFEAGFLTGRESSLHVPDSHLMARS